MYGRIPMKLALNLGKNDISSVQHRQVKLETFLLDGQFKFLKDIPLPTKNKHRYGLRYILIARVEVHYYHVGLSSGLNLEVSSFKIVAKNVDGVLRGPKAPVVALRLLQLRWTCKRTVRSTEALSCSLLAIHPSIS